jgi:protease II
MDAGHGGASGRFEALKELAKEFTFTGFRVELQSNSIFFMKSAYC